MDECRRKLKLKVVAILYITDAMSTQTAVSGMQAAEQEWLV